MEDFRIVAGFDVKEDDVRKNNDERQNGDESGYPIGEERQLAKIEQQNKDAEDGENENLRFLGNEFF